MPEAEIRDELPTIMNGAAWQSLARSKERWGASIQALLYRARRLGTLTEVSYRNAMTTLTGRGWRRGEPGLISVLEQPSMLPRAIELLAAEGITSPPPRPVPGSRRPVPDRDVPHPGPRPAGRRPRPGPPRPRDLALP